MKGDLFWPLLIRNLMSERGLSERAMCLMTGWSRATFRKYLNGQTPIPVNRLEFMLTMFGYELDAIRSEAS